MYEDITYSTDEGIATITIDRPEKRNAFTRTTIGELNSALESVHDDEGVHAAILTGAGGAFCAGADVDDLPNWHDRPKTSYISYLREIQRVINHFRTIPKPTIASLPGAAAGAGCDLALSCDVRIFGTDAFLRPGFGRLGLVPGDGGAWLLTKLVGESLAKDILFRGDDVYPSRALDLGLASEVSSAPLEAAFEYARALLSRPVLALGKTKQLVHAAESFEDHCDLAVEFQWACLNDEEHIMALQALREGRRPSFSR